MEGIPVTNIYYGISWFTTILSIVLLTIGLWNAGLSRSEKGFYAMVFVLSMFAAIAVQKNTRDMKMMQKIRNSAKGSVECDSFIGYQPSAISSQEINVRNVSS